MKSSIVIPTIVTLMTRKATMLYHMIMVSLIFCLKAFFK